MAKETKVIYKEDGTMLYPITWAAKEIGVTYQSLFMELEKRGSPLLKCVEFYKGKRMVIWPDIKDTYLKISKRALFEHDKSERKKARSSEDGSFHEASMRQKNLKSELMNLELQEKAGNLISLEAATMAWTSIANIVMRSMLSIPDRLAPQLVGIDDGKIIHDKMSHEIKQALKNLKWRESAKIKKG